MNYGDDAPEHGRTLHVRVTDGMAVTLAHRVKARRAKNTSFSRGDLIREALAEYFTRHPDPKTRVTV